MSVPILTGLRQIADHYDGFILDLWGIIHDGFTRYPGTRETLAELKRRGKRTVMLSNAPRRARSLIDLMTELGIERDLYGDIITSGEAVFLELHSRRDPWFAALGRRCLHVGTERDKDLFEGLALDLVEEVDHAEFLLVTGPFRFDDRVEDSAPLLQAAATRALPMVCANPDLVVISEGRPLVCAGALAAYYEDIGGDVRYRGKPDPAIYDVCMERLGIADRARVLAVGDAFRTDVAGAQAAGLSSLFCSGGIHAEEIGTVYGQTPGADALEAAIVRHGGLRPTAVIGGFIW
ncbi:TIGR01459 family HAD-type hydrolase [Telmatospirillum siberiense]|uniref:TIGR01459 family HAD-type hydrolase n=1 Tax=Telmatospirillum siberiense TaxID=382514 RepID=A0A2N3PPI1_9PROT|nr:TIGR01459 family HAD-type hydrolase [Telmatospirillum siberiense]PKU22311.1 TIGR01459 family HAD-type hydrolase [Telmatospirillum siberiense]